MTTGAGPVSDRITVRDHAITVDGKRAALYGGAMHYWRLDRDKWSEILDHVKEMGFTTISIYIPWEVHEVERGTFDFTGNKDVDAFLTLIEEKGLNIVVRPGPQINSELTGFGYPLRILADPEIQALNSQGTPAVLTQVPRPIPAVSYAADKFFAEAALWYDAICPILARHAYPKGRVLAAQVDNEMAFFFHVNAYASDYNPSAIGKYRAFLGQKYGAVEALNTAYGTSYSSFESVEPPRRWEATDKAEIPWYTDWIEYRERYLIDSLARLADMMRARGLGSIPLFHNYPHPLAPGGAVSGYTTPFNLMGLEEKLDFVGFDVYSRKELYEHIRTVLSYVVGTSRFPYIPEFIAGVWPWYLNPGDLGDEEFVTKAGIMQGIKGFSRYMLVERDRWLDSPIRRDGRVREDHAAMFARMNEVLACGRMTEARRQADVLLLANRDYDRLEAASVLVSFPGDFLETPSGFSEYPTFMTTAEDSLGFDEPIQQAKAAWFANAYDGLKDSGFAFLLSDTALSADLWSRFKAVVVSSFDYMSAEVQRKILAFADAGGTVVLGPRLPVLDDRMQPNTTLRDGLSGTSAPLVAGATNVGSVHDTGAGRVIVVTDFSAPADVLHAALLSLDLVSFKRSDARLDVAIHRAGTEPRVVVFVCNPTADRINARVGFSFRVRSAREVWEDCDAEVVDGSLAEVLEPYTIKIYECAL